MTRRVLLPAVLAAAVFTVQGCANLGYYSQSINGHLNLVSAAKPVDRLLKEPSQPEAVRQQLELAREIRQFATERLALPDNRSYRSYVDTGRDYVTWAVFAAPELSLNVKTWCFPVVGCVPYRGYFTEEAALAFAERVRAEGLDVYVGGVPAYSTLGWFNDPLLNTMFLRGESYLAGVVFHELSHQRVYVRDDTRFNEAFAVAVEQAGTTEWLLERAEPDKLADYRASQRREEDFLTLIAETRNELQRIYTSQASDDAKRAAKAAAIAGLRARYARMKTDRWNGYAGYDQWFAAPINNAKLATVAVYNDLVPAFTRLLEICDGNYGRFYRAVERLGKLDIRRRAQALAAAKSCG